MKKDYKRFNCTIKNYKGEIIHNKDYCRLSDIVENLGLTKAQVYDMHSRPTKFSKTKFIFDNNISINKILTDEPIEG